MKVESRNPSVWTYLLEHGRDELHFGIPNLEEFENGVLVGTRGQDTGFFLERALVRQEVKLYGGFAADTV